MTRRTFLTLGPHCGVFLPLAAAFFAVFGFAQGHPQSPVGSASQGASPVLEVATIKPVKIPNPNNMHDTTEGRRLYARNTSVKDLMMMGYAVDPSQIAGGPAWIATDEYDIDAEAVEGIQLDNEGDERGLLRELLADRFKLVFHQEQRTLASYHLVVAKSGLKLKTADPQSVGNSQCEHAGVCDFRSRTLSEFARFMQFVVLDRPVVDKTGVTGKFDFSLRWAPDESQFSRLGLLIRPPAEGSNAPPLFEAIQEQLGLKLEPVKAPVDVIVIDHIERPSEN